MDILYTYFKVLLEPEKTNWKQKQKYFSTSNRFTLKLKQEIMTDQLIIATDEN